MIPIVIFFLKYYGFFYINFNCFVFLGFVILCWDLLTFFFFCNYKKYIFHGLVSFSCPNWAWNRRNLGMRPSIILMQFFCSRELEIVLFKIFWWKNFEKDWIVVTMWEVWMVSNPIEGCVFFVMDLVEFLVLENKKDTIKEVINLNAWDFQQASLWSQL